MWELGRSLPNCDVRRMSAYPSIADMFLRRRQRSSAMSRCGDQLTSYLDRHVGERAKRTEERLRTLWFILPPCRN